MELSFMNLQEYEDHAKKLYKEVKRYEECVVQMHKLEQKMSSEMSNSPLCHDDEELKKIAEDYQVGFELESSANSFQNVVYRVTIQFVQNLPLTLI